MTDADLVAGRADVKRIEGAARAQMDASAADRAERDAAHAVLRQAVALRRVLDEWIVGRACRAPQEQALAR